MDKEGRVDLLKKYADITKKCGIYSSPSINFLLSQTDARFRSLADLYRIMQRSLREQLGIPVGTIDDRAMYDEDTEHMSQLNLANKFSL